MLVPREDLGVGNARLQAGFLTTNQLVGPPVGAFLFAVGTVWPFFVQVLCVALGALLVARIATPPGAPRDLEGTHVRRDIADGLRWIRRHPPVRTLALVILAFNVTWGAAWSVLVLWSQDVLGMGPVGYGLLTTAVAVGGLVEHQLVRRDRAAGAARDADAALPAARGADPPRPGPDPHGVGGLRDHGRLRGVRVRVGHRVADGADAGRAAWSSRGGSGSVYVVGLFLGLVIGQALGGVIADRWGLTAPFWFAFVGSGLTLALVWRQLASIAHVGEPSA